MPSLVALAADPSPLLRHFAIADASFVFRALDTDDKDALTSFLAGLSDTSRRFWHGDTDDAEEAARLIDAIGRYDKLRLVVHRVGRPDQLDGIVDLSFSLPDYAELGRYAGYGIALDPERTVRFGPCVSEAWQGRGLAAELLPPTWDAVRRLDRHRVVLFGGVHPDNHRAQRFYRRHGFVEVGTFTEPSGECVDMMLDLA